MWAGIAGAVVNGGSSIDIALSVHDAVYNTDFALHCIPYNRDDPEKSAIEIELHVIQTLMKFSQEHLCKFLGAGVTLALLKEVCIQLVL
jgi:alpha,alpha-trehalose phosphorylase (configuration-retaining)